MLPVLGTTGIVERQCSMAGLPRPAREMGIDGSCGLLSLPNVVILHALLAVVEAWDVHVEESSMFDSLFSVVCLGWNVNTIGMIEQRSQQFHAEVGVA